MVKTPDEIWADGPSGNPYQPEKSEIREWGNSLLPKTGGTMTGRLNIDNGTNTPPDYRPVVDVYGMMSIFNDQLRFWPDLDGDGDYDADIFAKSNFYLGCTGRFHLIPGKDIVTVPSVTAPGRHLFGANDIANYYQSGGNYGGDWFKDLIITRYNVAAPWMIFDESRGGQCGIGGPFPTATETVNGTDRDLYQVGARLHVIDSTQRVTLFESTGATVRIGFKAPSTTVEPTIGADGNDIAVRTDNLTRAWFGSTGFYPGVDNSIPCGKSGMRWSAIWSATGTIQTSDARTKDIEGRIEGDKALSLVTAIEPAVFRYKVGRIETTFENDGTDVTEYEEKILVPKNSEGRDIESMHADEEFEERTIVRQVETPRVKEVHTEVQGSRLHAGFIAQDVKLGLDQAGLDLAVWGLEDKADPDSQQFIRPDQMVAVLWAAVRRLNERVEELSSG